MTRKNRYSSTDPLGMCPTTWTLCCPVRSICTDRMVPKTICGSKTMVVTFSAQMVQFGKNNNIQYFISKCQINQSVHTHAHGSTQAHILSESATVCSQIHSQ